MQNDSQPHPNAGSVAKTTTDAVTSKALWDGGRKLNTSTGKPIAEFTMKVYFYDSLVDRETGEMVQKQWTYRGWHVKRNFAKINQKYPTDLDALLTYLKQIHHKCQRVIIYDNKQHGWDEDLDRPNSEILHLCNGVTIIGKNSKPVNKLKQYRLQGLITITAFPLDIKHAA